jgi:hypothetical protein
LELVQKNKPGVREGVMFYFLIIFVISVFALHILFSVTVMAQPSNRTEVSVSNNNTIDKLGNRTDRAMNKTIIQHDNSIPPVANDRGPKCLDQVQLRNY